MKKIILMLFVVMIANTITEAQKKVTIKDSDGTVIYEMKQKLPDSVLVKMSIVKFCNELGIPSQYNKRYEAIILPLCDAGIHLFNAENNIYCKGVNEKNITNGRSEICYCYVGNSIQNEILKRNILANRQLIKNGFLSVQDAKKWKIVK